jgi:hypothetical protein
MDKDNQEISELFAALVNAVILMADELEKSNVLSKRSFADACDKAAASGKTAADRALFSALSKGLRQTARERQPPSRH